MKKVLIEVYNIDELEDNVFEKIYSKWLETFEYPTDEVNKTLETFCEYFGVELGKEISLYDNTIHFCMDIDEVFQGLKGIRLLKYLYNNYFNILFKSKKYYSNKSHKFWYSKIQYEHDYSLTGYDCDNAILEPIYNFLKKPSDDITFYDLIEECLYNWLFYYKVDYEITTSSDFFYDLNLDSHSLYFKNGDFYGYDEID